MYRDDLTGKRFSKLVVIEISTPNKRKGGTDRYWKCKCDCGKIKRVRQYHLTDGRIQSCGCEQFQKRSKHPAWKGCGEFSGTFFKTIEHGARIRKLDFNITKEYIWDLFLKQNRKCALTGLELKFCSKYNIPDGTASLDRIDSSKGYVPGNVQWIHKNLNKMKMEFSQDQFIDYCKLVVENSKSSVLL